jgi:hypothetical protein
LTAVDRLGVLNASMVLTVLNQGGLPQLVARDPAHRSPHIPSTLALSGQSLAFNIEPRKNYIGVLPQVNVP